jgi:HAD superfamily hydrolase (TIGR01490 family)
MTGMSSAPRLAAFFDFDATLVKHDSLPLFLSRCTGWPKTLFTFALALLTPDRSQPDLKGAVKASWLRHALAGMPEAQARKAAEGLVPNWIPDIRQRLLDLKAEGAVIVVATGALDLYVRALLKDLPVDVIMATDMESENGVLTGRMKGGNCVRLEKARRVEEFLRSHGPFDRTYGFGNAPSDLPMLKLVDEARVI